MHVARRFRKTVRRGLQRSLIYLADHFNYYLVRGHVHPENRLDHRRLISGDWFTCVDLVRNATVETLSREIYRNKIEGAVAEVGVYQGEFAALIHHYFNDRVLYLFDTFEGFDRRDAALDKEKHYSPAMWDFSDTSPELVLSKMKDKSKVQIKKGYFPASAKGCEEERFCFVSLDADLYEPTYAGLCWFYPRLVDGGYIMVHDYESHGYKGVREAVDAFARTTSISYIVLPDMAGSLIVGKPLRRD